MTSRVDEQAQPKHLRSVAERLNIFQDVEAREQAFEHHARDLTNNLFILLRAAGFYDLENQALEQPYELFLRSVSGLYELVRASIIMRLSDGNFFVNRRQVKVDFSTFQNTRYLIKIFDFLEINELTFEPEISKGDLKQLLTTFVRLVRDKRGHFRDTLIPNITARKLKIGEVHSLLTAREGPKQVASWYAKTTFVTQHYYHDTAHGRVPEYALLKRSLLELIELPIQSTPLLGSLHLLSASEEIGGVVAIQSVEAAGLTQVIAEALQLPPEDRLTLATAAVQLFQGWTLLRDHPVDYASTGSTKEIFERLESPRADLKVRRNEIIRTLLNLGGINESVLQRIMITFEAQRSIKNRDDHATSRAKRSYPSEVKSLHHQIDSEGYPRGLSRSFLSDIVYGAHLFASERRLRGSDEAMRALRSASLLDEVKQGFFQTLGAYPPSTPVEMTDGSYAIVTQCYGDQVRQVVPVTRGTDLHQMRCAEPVQLRPTSPVQVKRSLTSAEQATHLSRDCVRALIFSHPT